MSFLDIRFPDDISYGTRGGPMLRTTITITEGGDEKRLQHWNRSKRKYDVAYGIKNTIDMGKVIDFFITCKGRLHSFRFKDWSDYKATNESLVSGPTIQLTKKVEYGSYLGEYRQITKPVNNGTFKLYKNGVLQTLTTHYTIDYNTGIVTIVSYSAGTYTWSGEFDVQVRFDIDEIMPVADEYNINSLDGIILIETKNA